MAFVVLGAINQLQCTMGVAPMPIAVLQPMVLGLNMPIANIQDCMPMTNIMPFVLCRNPTNPAVASIIAASLGTVTVGPCVPLPTPWIPTAPTIWVRNLPVLCQDAIKICFPGGIIKSIPVPNTIMCG